MKVILVEDELLAAQRLERLIYSVDEEVEILAHLTSVESTINWLSSNAAPDLIFMDIQLEDGLSFEIVSALKIQIPIIFTTAYDKYTLKAFKVNSVDYLLKPIDKDELGKSIEKFRSVFSSSQQVKSIEEVVKQFPKQEKERFLVKIGSRYKSIPTLSIHCFYILERSCFMLCEDGKSYAIDYSLDKIQELISAKLFFRVNRNCLIHYAAITDMLIYSSSRLKLTLQHATGLEDIMVSRDRVYEFKLWMDR